MSAAMCCVDGCGNGGKIVMKMCNMHYLRWRNHGDTSIRKRRADGAGTIETLGYVAIKSKGVTKKEHVIIAEKALGRPLPDRAEVHHVNTIRSDNRNENLVICPNRAYHRLLHIRTAALEACGNVDWRMCFWCRKHDDTGKMRLSKPGPRWVHPQCLTAYNLSRSHKNRAQAVARPQ